MIKVEHLTKYYGGVPAIRDVTFEVAKGEIVGFLGPNAAGKTTTMRILTGYMPATSGQAWVNGYDVFAQSLDARRQIGYLPETVPLYPEMSVRDYLTFMARIKGVPRRIRKSRVDETMERTHVHDVADKLVGKLSRGYRQRVGLAQALVADPPVLILDEPTVGLDPRQINETRALIKSLGGDHTIILSTHILPEVSMTCSRVIVINEGRIAAVDTPANLDRRLRGGDSVQLEVRGPQEEVASALRALPHVTQVEVSPGGQDGRATYIVTSELGRDLREQLAATVVSRGWGLMELRPVALSLEEIFIKLTTTESEEAAAS